LVLAVISLAGACKLTGEELSRPAELKAQLCTNRYIEEVNGCKKPTNTAYPKAGRPQMLSCMEQVFSGYKTWAGEETNKCTDLNDKAAIQYALGDISCAHKDNLKFNYETDFDQNPRNAYNQVDCPRAGGKAAAEWLEPQVFSAPFDVAEKAVDTLCEYKLCEKKLVDDKPNWTCGRPISECVTDTLLGLVAKEKDDKTIVTGLVEAYSRRASPCKQDDRECRSKQAQKVLDWIEKPPTAADKKVLLKAKCKIVKEICLARTKHIKPIDMIKVHKCKHEAEKCREGK
jgi:hypothetical protein